MYLGQIETAQPSVRVEKEDELGKERVEDAYLRLYVEVLVVQEIIGLEAFKEKIGKEIPRA